MSVVIHTPRFTEAEAHLPKTGIGGRFHVELRDAATGLIKQAFTMPNLITTVGLNSFLGTSGASTLDTLLNFAAVGTNNTAPTNADTALGAQVGSRVTGNGGIADAFATSIAPDFVSIQRTREWGTAEGNGNLTEIGFFNAASGGVMWCRALFRDGGGTPVTVVKTASDILRVTYELRIYPALGDSTQTGITISGTPYNFVWRPVTRTLWPISLWSGGLVGVARNTGAQVLTRTTLLTRWGTDFDTGTDSTSASITYDAANLRHQRTHIFDTSVVLTIGAIQIAATQNVSGQRCQYVGTVSPTMAKTGSNQLTLNFNLDWSRVVI